MVGDEDAGAPGCCCGCLVAGDDVGTVSSTRAAATTASVTMAAVLWRKRGGVLERGGERGEQAERPLGGGRRARAERGQVARSACSLKA